ncbi:unnamed protein product [Didymodactylos carnosus]|uniref:Gelsolin-like domain-containing protein n=1 Tax=Didymodactylos carnosus TaxID=1234261 RepID=A0A814TQG3_9BILA|nr:unnamed protein product [Didymodactylos carnosus]CAF1161256.1 unnamed protein product [Didymodactylos carnosus]CAF3677885.1 unnamed protein product [Didymodactylos carnosus]CAF3924848.1 unnamed protein product [Didymodactylos carnosus]
MSGARLTSTEKEKAWINAGRKVGLEIWRIEQFNVKPWPKRQYRNFYTGDSYIILNTHTGANQTKIRWDIHIWVGNASTQDEYGTAAFKAVELDDSLGGIPVQHRESEGHESSLFMSYFKNQIKILAGGTESGFNQVRAKNYQQRLLRFKGKKLVRITQVPLERASLNSGDVFVLDLGLVIYQWNGSKSAGQERMKAAQYCRALDDERGGLPEVIVLEEGDQEEKFWCHFPEGFGSVKSARKGGVDDEVTGCEKELYRLSDASGTLKFTKVATGNDIRRDLLNSNDVFILDIGSEIFAWVGRGSSVAERKMAMSYANEYLIKKHKLKLPVSRILEGGENEVFEHSMNW